MNLNKFYTVMIVPEKTSEVRRFVIPAWIVRTSAMGIAFTTLFGMVMFYDYWRVMGEISENKQLKMENRRLRQQVQVFKNKVATIESTMERVKTLATRLKVITNIEDHGGLLQTLNQSLPDSSSNLGNLSDVVQALTHTQLASQSNTSNVDTDEEVDSTSRNAASAGSGTNAGNAANTGNATQSQPSPGSTAAGNGTQPPTAVSSSAPTAMLESPLDPENPEDALLRREYDDLDERMTLLNRDSLYTETELQDLYELLGDQKAFLSALPTRKPAVGYFTSGFGIRKSPIGGKVKMHEGLDIANHIGTPIRAPADGVVIFAEVKSGYGQTVILDHGYGLETWYGHTKKILVSKGQHVRRGDTIALVGNTGRSTGPHVHYEVRVNGYPVNPLSYILEN